MEPAWAHRKPLIPGTWLSITRCCMCVCLGMPQVKKCADAGADIVRITVQGKREAEACAKIRQRLFEDG